MTRIEFSEANLRAVVVFFGFCLAAALLPIVLTNTLPLSDYPNHLARTYMEISPWMAIFPGLAIMIVVLGFNFLGDGLRDILDPRLRGS